jgi:phage regulator Rha-like protein
MGYDEALAGYGAKVTPRGGGSRMGLDDTLKQQIRERAPELKRKLVDEFDELTHKDMDEASDDPDEIVDHIQKKTGQPREQVEQRVTQVMHRS